MLRALDIWRCAIVDVPASELIQSDLTTEKIRWLPESTEKHSFRADPFGIWENDRLHVFVERFDYRILKGEIELLSFDQELNFLGSRVVLRRPWHLSYPIVFKNDHEIYMLPEASRSGELMMYRASSFPFNWEPVGAIGVPGSALDATPFFHEGRWWLLYAIADKTRDRSCALHLAFADRPVGPFHLHPLNPIRTGPRGSRPAGTPITSEEGVIHAPVQDSSRTYGGAVRRLSILRLDETHFDAEEEDWIHPSPALFPFDSGLHTISAAGGISLIDCKFLSRSIPGSLAWRLGKLARRNRERRGIETCSADVGE